MHSKPTGFSQWVVHIQGKPTKTGWTYKVIFKNARGYRKFSIDVMESGLSGRSIAVFEAELSELVDEDYEEVASKQFRMAWSGDWEWDMRSLCSDVLNFGLKEIESIA